ncbi:FliH/SctL family protein [Limnohabitans sp. 2KL-51]|uniref:FliH/SctL family protein n=1 Tax=Limnohabitans sp. 2KL-51 TaxID=1977911 RepID=UPI001304895A|nr:FliH/SctL family protein [Limnohabitans sp. 2KL-51]
MALSDLNAQAAPWSANPLLNGKSQTPSFLRTQWDEAKAHAFGPWRVADRSEPTDALTLPSPLNANEFTDDNQKPQHEATQTAALTAPEPEKNHVSEAVLAKMLDESFQRGIQEGQANLHAQLDAERDKERELIRHLGIELRSISQDPQRFFEPLKRLSLHLAEQLVRAELQISGQAIQGLVQSCIQQLDHPAQPVKVSLNPQDMKRLQTMGEAATAHLELEADPQLRPGSVRVRVQDSVVQDLIEHRLESLARRLLPQPEAWMQTSSLVQDKVDAMPENTPKRDWDRQVIDVQDTDAKSTGPTAPDGDMPA